MAALVKCIVRITSQKMGIKMPCKMVQWVKVLAAKTRLECDDLEENGPLGEWHY